MKPVGMTAGVGFGRRGSESHSHAPASGPGEVLLAPPGVKP